MRLKIIGIYGVLILALGFGISYGLDLKLSDNQDEAMRQSADRALRHAQSALEAQGLEIVSLAGRAALRPSSISSGRRTWRRDSPISRKRSRTRWRSRSAAT